jgi:AcrR family transcriptional regulator
MPTTPKRKSVGHKAKSSGKSPRRAIAEHAVRLMEDRGFAAVSVQHLADALEFSKANFYHHIDSKENLLHEIFVDTLQFSLGHLEDILGRADPVPKRLRSLVEFYVSMMIERRAVMLVWFKERAHLTPAHLREVTQLEQQIGARLEEFYAQGIAEGYFKPLQTDVIRIAVFGMCFMLTKLSRANRGSVASITRQLQDLLASGLLASEGSPV